MASYCGNIACSSLISACWVSTICCASTVLAAGVLLLHMPDVSRLADLAADPSVDVSALGGDLTHSVGGLLVLLAPLVLNIYKPRGMTRYGQRKQRDQRSRARPVRQA